jgi:thiol-disulfide isomerase/thioredoxin
MLLSLASCAKTDSSSEGAELSSPTSGIKTIGEFTTVDLDGNEVTQDVFADAKITMINFWGTYCNPCIKELPELQKISKKYEGDAQLIGVPIDVDFSDKDSAAYKNALKYLEWAEADYLNIQIAGGLLEYAQTMQYVPTSIFVDSEGNIICDPVIGPMTDDYKQVIEDYLEHH